MRFKNKKTPVRGFPKILPHARRFEGSRQPALPEVGILEWGLASFSSPDVARITGIESIKDFEIITLSRTQ